MKLRVLFVLLGLLAVVGCVEVQRTVRGEAAAGDREPDWGPVPGSAEDAADEDDGEAEDADQEDAEDTGTSGADDGATDEADEVGPEPPGAEADEDSDETADEDGDEGDQEDQEEPETDQAPSEPPELPDDLEEVTTDTGLRYIDVEVGTGAEAESGDALQVHYTGWLEEDGTKFDSSLDRGEPVVFTLDVSSRIQGWHEGFAGMREGSKRRLIIPPELAYGESGFGASIPPNATLIFDVELLAVNP